MLEFLSSVLDFLSCDLIENAYLVAITPLLTNFLVFIIELIALSFSKRERDSAYYLCFSIIGITISAYFSIQDFLGEKRLFTSGNLVYAFLSFYGCLIIIFYAVIRKLSSKPVLVKSPPKVLKEEVLLSPSRAVNYFKKPDIENGYLDIGYVKSLICELKTKPLSDSDYREIEEFEVYLLRFISRQPEGEERKIISAYLSSLIKKLALYA